MDKPYLTSKGLADRWKMSSYTIRYWRISGKGPVYHKFGGRVRYYLEDIEHFEKAKRRKHTSEPANTFLCMTQTYS